MQPNDMPVVTHYSLMLVKGKLLTLMALENNLYMHLTSLCTVIMYVYDPHPMLASKIKMYLDHCNDTLGVLDGVVCMKVLLACMLAYTCLSAGC